MEHEIGWPPAIVEAYERGEQVWFEDGRWVASDGTGKASGPAPVAATRPAAAEPVASRLSPPAAPRRVRERVFDPQQIEASNLLYACCPRCGGLLAEEEVWDGHRKHVVAMCADVEGCGWRAWTFAAPPVCPRGHGALASQVDEFGDQDDYCLTCGYRPIRTDVPDDDPYGLRGGKQRQRKPRVAGMSA